MIAAAVLGSMGGFSKVADWAFVASANWWWYPLWAVASAALLLRRRRPVFVTSVALVVFVVQAASGDVALPWTLLIGLYTIAAYRGAWWGWFSALGAVLMATAVAALPSASTHSIVLEVTGAVIAVLFGLTVGGRRAYLSALIDRAAQLEREKDQQARLVASAERARIAREFHDVVAHGMSVMISLSDGADAVADLDPERSREAVRRIGVVGRDALTDMRRLLGVLGDQGSESAAGRDRHDEVALAPQPRVADIDDLVATYRTAGLPVVVKREGSLPRPDAAQLVIYRTVQEGLTNALRYAVDPTRVEVALRGLAETTVVQVSDDGVGTAPASSVGTERGLIGLRERAALFGGTIEAGPRSAQGGRGWRVKLSLPITPESQHE